MTTTINSGIDWRGLQLNPYLGWPSAERAQPQTIMLDMHIYFAEPPKACHTDDLADTYCYESFINLIKSKINAQPFRLLEHVGYEIYQTIKPLLSSHHRVHIRIRKQPAISDLTGGVCFYYGDGNYTW